MRILSWNINGLRAKLKDPDGAFLKFMRCDVNQRKYDILCFQEQKCNLDTLLSEDMNGNRTLKYFEQYKHIAHTKEIAKKGYAGVCILSKLPFEYVQVGLNHDVHDLNGRVITVKLANTDIVLISAYVPNSGEGLKNLSYRCAEWNVDFMNHIEAVERMFPTSTIVLCGDFNAAHHDTDVYDMKRFKNKMAGFHDDERNWISSLVKDHNYLDAFEQSIDLKTLNHYTFWSNLGGMRKKNKGWRIDYFFIKNGAYQSCTNLQYVCGSDHCPLELNLA